MKLISWNVNGLRAIHRKGKFLPLFHTNPDIVCLQEIKTEEHQLPEEVRKVHGYHAYFSHSKGRKGYSGVAVYTKIEPDKVEYGMGIPHFDDEGRMLVLYLKDIVLLNIYFPNGGGGPERLQYKLDFYDAFLEFIEKLRKDGKKIIFCGDINTAHEEIDLARPKANKKNTGFLPEERAWIDELISHGYIDTYRALHPHTRDAYTYWDIKSHARDRNVGWRLDYFFVSSDLATKVSKSEMMTGYEGSDHCPIVLEVKDSLSFMNMNKKIKEDEIWENTGWAFAIINNKLAEFYFNKKSKKIVAHCYVKLEDYKTKREQKMIRDDVKRNRFTWRNKEYKQIQE